MADMFPTDGGPAQLEDTKYNADDVKVVEGGEGCEGKDTEPPDTYEQNIADGKEEIVQAKAQEISEANTEEDVITLAWQPGQQTPDTITITTEGETPYGASYNPFITIPVFIAVVIAIISVCIGLGYIELPPNDISFTCPERVLFVSTNTNKEISAFDGDHPGRSEYEWEIIKHDESLREINLISGKDTDTLMLPKFDNPGEILIKLKISVTFWQIFHFGDKCEVKVIVHEKPILGIDLGTTYSCVAYQKNLLNKDERRDTKIVVLDKKKNEYCIPSAVYFTKDRKVIIGRKALDNLESDPHNVIYHVKVILTLFI